MVESCSVPTSVAIAVITYRRPELLGQLLDSLQRSVVGPEYAVRIVVVDNDPDGSAEASARSPGPFPVHYEVESDPGIPAARQRSVELTTDDDTVVFVDDDEFVDPDWLQRLLTARSSTGADVVTGPIVGILPDDAPAWARHSDVYTTRGRHRTGTELGKAYTNNTLVTRRVLDAVTPAFHQAFRFTGSSDLHFFLRVAKAGFRIVWIDEAVVYEVVPPERVTLRWLVRRAFRSGAGDTISRHLIRPGLRTKVWSGLIGIARMGNGLLLLLTGVISPSSRIKGVRRLISGVGTIAGLFGVNHAEYRRG